MLGLLMVPQADKYTTKCFRAGRATDLAKHGVALGEIMAMGEWRSDAVRRYLDTDAIDEVALFQECLCSGGDCCELIE